MNYEPREGVVLVTVCGVKLLIPDRKALKYCQNGIRLSFIGLLVWNTVSQGRDMQYAIKILSEISRKQPDQCEEMIMKELDKLVQAGFIVNVENAHDNC